MPKKQTFIVMNPSNSDTDATGGTCRARLLNDEPLTARPAMPFHFVLRNSGRMRRQFVATLGLLVLSVPLMLSGCASNNGALEDVGPTRVVIVVDETESFAVNLPKVAQIIGRSVRENALAGESEVYLVAMDRNPRPLAFFDAEKLLNADSEAILDSISQPTSQDGTDVVKALQIASGKLHKKKGLPPSRRFLLVFSDMRVDSATTPKHREFAPIERFAWDSLKDVECHFFFVASDMETRVSNLLERNGIEGEVLDALESKRISPQAVVEGE